MFARNFLFCQECFGDVSEHTTYVLEMFSSKQWML